MASSGRATSTGLSFPAGESITRRSSGSSTGCWSGRGRTSRRGTPGPAPGLRAILPRQAHWLDDYALFRALKTRHGGAHYLEWPEPSSGANRRPSTRRGGSLPTSSTWHRFGQFLVVTQGGRLREYAHARGLRLIGDLPFFVSPDSADVWANPEFFQLDERAPAQVRRRRASRLLQPRRASSGATRVYDWEALAGRVTAGGSTACAPCWPTWTWSASTTSAASRPPGTFRPVPPRPESGQWLPGPGRRPLPRRPGGPGPAAAHRRGPGADHARGPPAARGVRTSPA